MTKYRSKPVEKEAFLYGVDIPPRWFTEALEAGVVTLNPATHRGNPYALISTLEGQMRAEAGDYIIQGLKGEIYSCKADVFEKTYEPVEEIHPAKGSGD